MKKEDRKLVQLAVPAMLENFLQMLMGMVDSYLVASLGILAISGVSLASSVLAIYQALFLALVASISSFASKHLAKKESERAQDLARSGMGLTVILSLFLGAASIFLGPWLLQSMGASSGVDQAGSLYLSIVGGGILFQGLMMSLGAILRTWGRSQLPMWVSLVANVGNILLSSLFLYGLGWGLTGVALGTVLSRLLAVAYLWRQVPFPLLGGSWKWDSSLLSFALPAAGERLMMRAGDFLIMLLVVSFGTEVVAGNAIGETLIQLNHVPALGMATAGVIVFAQAWGQRDRESLAYLLDRLYKGTVLLMLPLSLLMYLGAVPLTSLYNQDPQVIAASQVVLLFSLLGTPMTAGTLIYTSLWQGLGQSKLPFYATTIGMWVLRLGLGAILGHFMGWGLMGIWVGTLVDNSFRWWWLRHRYQHFQKMEEIA